MKIILAKPVDLDTITPADLIEDTEGALWFRDSAGTWQVAFGPPEEYQA